MQIKHPPVVYARQANFANGPQQINNGAEAPRTRENEIPLNKLLEEEHGQRLDTGATTAIGRADQELATMGVLDGTSDHRR